MDPYVRPPLPEALLHHLRNPHRHLPHAGHLALGLVTREYERPLLGVVVVRACAFGEYRIRTKFREFPVFSPVTFCGHLRIYIRTFPLLLSPFWHVFVRRIVRDGRGCYFIGIRRPRTVILSRGIGTER